MEGLCEPGPEAPESREALALLDAHGRDRALRRAGCLRVKLRLLVQAELCATAADRRFVRASNGLCRLRSAAQLPRRGVQAKDRSRSTHSRRGVCVACTFEQAPTCADSTARRTSCGANCPSTDDAALMRNASGTALCSRKPQTSTTLVKHRSAADA
jgi:hypothetical protein